MLLSTAKKTKRKYVAVNGKRKEEAANVLVARKAELIEAIENSASDVDVRPDNIFVNGEPLFSGKNLRIDTILNAVLAKASNKNASILRGSNLFLNFIYIYASIYFLLTLSNATILSASQNI